jgi:tRNA (guanine-N7-)-methyltransferase
LYPTAPAPSRKNYEYSPGEVAGALAPRLLEPGSLRQVYTHFPDPNDRTKFHRHRVVTPAFLDATYQALAPGGGLSLMADHGVLFEDLLATVEAESRFQKNGP